MRSDHGHLTAYQIACEVGLSVGLVLRPAILDHDILALDVAGFAEALAEWRQIACTIARRRAAEKSDHRHRRLLRARCEWRRCCRAAEKRYERAPLHSITSSAATCKVSGTLRPSVLAVLRLVHRSNLVD